MHPITNHTTCSKVHKSTSKGELSRSGHGSDIRIFKGICDLLRMSRISNFSICFASKKYGYSEKRISGK